KKEISQIGICGWTAMGCCGSKKRAPKEPKHVEVIAPAPVAPVAPAAESAPTPKPESPKPKPVRFAPGFRIGLGAQFPNFQCRTTHGNFSFYSFLEKSPGWTMLFSHPKDFTPVCTTEIGTCHVLLRDFQKRKVQLIGLSCDSVEQHKAWYQDVLSVKNVELYKDMGFPLIADETREIAELLGMLDPLEICDDDKLSMPARALFLIGPEKRCRYSILYPATTGRNFAEILRVIDSLIVSNISEVGTPANWHPGDDVMPAMHLAEAEHKGAQEKSVPSGRRYMRHLPMAMPVAKPVKPSPHVTPVTSDFKIQLGAVFPDFDWCATKQGINRFHKLLERLKGDLIMMIVWPRNFDPVGTTELLSCLQILPDLRARNVTLLGMTCDEVENLEHWIKDAIALSETHTMEDLPFTMIADKTQHIAVELGLLPAESPNKDTSPARGLFVIGKDKKLRLSMHYPMSTGLNFFEILRVLDSLILTKDCNLATPANWQQGDRVVVEPKVPTKDANARFRNLKIQSLPSQKEYLRWVDCPKLKWFDAEASLPPAPLLGAREWEPVPLPIQEPKVRMDRLDEPDVLCTMCSP
ncbi:unnamed protein product, partial [Effrenium voratum]